jgi:hypothetical protein
MMAFFQRDRRKIQRELYQARPVETCDFTRIWNNQRCMNTADVIINGVAICAECATRSGAVRRTAMSP